MAEFFQLSTQLRLEALNQAADTSGRPPHLLEKDAWVVWALQHIFTGPHAEHLVFKGGTSLSKAFGVIRRFSEDVDLTYDIRVIAGDLVGNAATALPANKSQEKKWSREIRGRLARWVSTDIAPRITRALEQSGLQASVRVEDANLHIEYAALVSTGTGYVRPAVMLEFGARSTGEPCAPHTIHCDAAAHLQGIEFPVATPMVMRAERTFWEKATAIHVFCAQGEFRGGDRFARHWHDITRLDATGYADAAVADNALAQAVADHKAIFFAEKDVRGEVIDYHAAVSGELRLVPEKDALDKLAVDYRRMVEDGLFLDDVETFEALLDRCRVIEKKANAARAGP